MRDARKNGVLIARVRVHFTTLGVERSVREQILSRFGSGESVFEDDVETA